MTHKILLPVTFTIALLCVLYPWVTIQGQYLVAGNVSWLLIAAERLLAGQDLAQHIYETNPPLSILIYTPHVMFSHFASMPLTIGSFYVTSFLVIISALFVHAIISKFDHLSEIEKTTLLLAHLIATTLATSVFFSDREHFIILGLIPFIFCQYAMTEHIAVKRHVLWPVMIIGALCVLIKPHYGLLPAAFLFHRAISHRTFRVLFHADFVALAVMTLAYLAVVFIFFQGYITTILPDVLALYTKNGLNLIQIIHSTRVHIILFLCVFLFEAFREDLPQKKKNLLIWLYLSCLLCMIPYYVQMKGFYNHFVPAYAFFLIALSLSVSFRTAFKKAPIFALIIPCIVLAGSLKISGPLNTDFPKQNDIPHLPVTRFLEEHCVQPCTFFAFHSDIEIMNPTAARMGYTHASRFPVLWFLPQILEHPEKYADLRQKYTRYMVEDLTHYKPAVILLAQDLPIGSGVFDFLEYFEDIRPIIDSDYTKIEDFEFDRAAYFKGTTLQKSYIYKYDVYTLNP